MVIIGISLVVVLMVSIAMFRKASRTPGMDEFIFVISTIASSVCLVTFLISWPICYYEEAVNIEKFKAIQTTLRIARAKGQPIENAAMMMEVMKANQWLAKSQYWRDSIFKEAWPAEIERLKPIE